MVSEDPTTCSACLGKNPKTEAPAMAFHIELKVRWRCRICEGKSRICLLCDGYGYREGWLPLPMLGPFKRLSNGIFLILDCRKDARS
jgi:hypothetical protein